MDGLNKLKDKGLRNTLHTDALLKMQSDVNDSSEVKVNQVSEVYSKIRDVCVQRSKQGAFHTTFAFANAYCRTKDAVFYYYTNAKFEQNRHALRCDHIDDWFGPQKSVVSRWVSGRTVDDTVFVILLRGKLHEAGLFTTFTRSVYSGNVYLRVSWE